ncbi:MAG TPA: flagellar hook-associated protein FlgK [Methylocella sp.]|nr:flagellar hook-associated protein FlgK [Methylocella sp.]
MSLSTASNIAQSGLNTVSSEISVLSRNIAGANNTGISSEKTANIITALGGGSQVASITRATNLAVFQNLLQATSANAAQTSLLSGISTLNQTIGNISSSSSSSGSADNSPAALLSNFTNALQSFEASPSDSSLATAAVSQASALAQGLNSATATINTAREQADAGIATSVQTINSLLSQFQSVNTQIVNGMATGADVTDAQDARDTILTQLAQQIGISTTTSPNGGMSIYTDSGVTLFQGGTARTVTFSPTATYTPSTTGNAVYVDGVPITGSSASTPISTGNIAGLANLRDNLATTYQAQLDNMAGALIATFAESPQSGSGPNLPGLFTTPGATALPTSTTGLAGQITINPSVDPSQGGNPFLLRDGGISGNANYVYNTTGQASYSARLSQLLTQLSAPQTFAADGDIATNTSLSAYASGSVGWLENQYSTASSQQTYQSTLVSTATTALSNSTGVNIDTEMSKMLDLENSYSATAKLISAIDSMFNTLVTNLSNITVPA